jgi:hypothetical protein
MSAVAERVLEPTQLSGASTKKGAFGDFFNSLLVDLADE